MRFSTTSLLPLLASLSLILLLFSASPASAATPTSSSLWYCRCTCFSNTTIIPIFLPADPKLPCASCTQKWCLDQKIPACLGASLGTGDLDTGSGKDGDVEARCFKRDSPRDRYIIVAFLFVSAGLLGYALLQPRLQAAGVDPRNYRDYFDAVAARAQGRVGGGRNDLDVRQTYRPVPVPS